MAILEICMPVCLAFIGPKVEKEMRGLVSGRWDLKFMLKLTSMFTLNEVVLELPLHCRDKVIAMMI